MSAPTKLLDLKVRGLDDGSATLATQDVELWSDGSWRFTVDSRKYTYSGNDSAVNRLLTTIFAHADGLDPEGDEIKLFPLV